MGCFLRGAFLAMGIGCVSGTNANGTVDPLVIEWEEISYSLFSNETSYDVQTDFINALQIECQREVMIQSEEGITLMDDFCLPEPIDPLYHETAPASRKAHFYLDNLKIESITIAIERNGKRIRVDVQKPQQLTREVFIQAINRYGSAYMYCYDLPVLQVGDVVHLNYSVRIPFRENIHELNSFRVFFHGKWPKKKARFRFSYRSTAPIKINYRNGSEPHSSFQKEMVTDRWDFENLPGCLDEINARPYKTLPHFEVSCFPELRNEIVYPRTTPIFENQLSVKIGSTSKQFQLLRQFVDAHYPEADAAAYELLDTIFNRIGPDFRYASDEIYFQGEQLFKPKMGEDLTEGRIRESIKYETYAAIFNMLGLDYYFVFVMDARTGEVSETFVKPKFRGDFLYAPILSNGDIVFIYPKYMQCGTFLEELPFYFEHTNMELVQLYPDKYLKYGRNFSKAINEGGTPSAFTTSPVSTEKDNYRKIAARVLCTPSSNKLAFDTRLTLSGQFSTLTRCNYLCNEAFPGIDTAYHRMFSDGLASETVTYEKESVEPRYPFTAKFKTSFESWLAPRENAVELTISLKHWLSHIRCDLDTADRTLDYYPDFRYSDHYTYFLEFTEAVEYTWLPEPISVSNHFGYYYFEVAKVSDKALAISSHARITTESVSPAQINDVWEFYNAIARAQACEIRVTSR